jgi:hypothetical protein
MRCAPRSRPRYCPAECCRADLWLPLSAAALAACFTVLGLSPREAQAATEDGAPFAAPPSVRRSGFVLGLSGGLSLGSANGYPNDVAEIGLPEFEVGTGLGVNSGNALWIGGSLADWFNVAVGFQRVSFKGNGLDATGGNLHIRLEAFPLFYRGGAWQDLGLTFSAGTGNVTVERDGESVAEGEGASAVGFGAFFEPIRFWQLSTGPDIIYTHQFSRSMSAHLFVVGWRLAFYGGP